jgi:hypothetical protein
MKEKERYGIRLKKPGQKNKKKNILVKTGERVRKKEGKKEMYKRKERMQCQI